MVVICADPYASSFQMVIKLIDDAQGPPKNDIVGKNDDGIFKKKNRIFRVSIFRPLIHQPPKLSMFLKRSQRAASIPHLDFYCFNKNIFQKRKNKKMKY